MANAKLSKLQSFLIGCSGADTETLMACASPVRMKYAQLGFLILIPAIFGFISASYWLSTVFGKDPHGIYIALGGGLFWGIVIFSLDRFLVMTIKKSESVLRDLFSVSVISRMALAVLIGYVVAHPLVLKMFEPNLKEMLHERNEVKASAITEEWGEKITKVNDEIKTLVADTEKLKNGSSDAQTCSEDPELQKLVTAKQEEISAAEQEFADEVAGRAGSRTGRPTIGPVARAIRGRIDTLHNQLTDLHSRLGTALANCNANFAAMQQSISEARQLRTTQLQQLTTQFDKKQQELAGLETQKQAKLRELNEYAAYDFLTLSNALDELAQKNTNISFWEKLLTAVLCAVDLLAMLIKMTCKQDEYDKKKQADERQRFQEVDTQLKAYLESENLYLQNALELQKNQATRMRLQQQAEYARQKLMDMNTSLSELAEINNEFSEIMSFLQVMGKISSTQSKNLLEEYHRVVSTLSTNVIEQTLH
ncbi:MAG: DUF4407 domain-containing protein [Methylovulum sp.]|nr:DUF4407 domain-containing protein [Methylovulum sp.]